ncbi:shock factor protein 2 [Seminavis robusta]|uniref:Shock factor protein 2 n=1 Tax=Seminavis robusta TaxID=568900 RepID=A0A9N8HJA6_9STRA|nr:shock factor protein 2 [Seminavis robusta]|eukprot:Sro680_g186220.1 shock factor protein 2 (663) ;mRNA; f:23217-25451
MKRGETSPDQQAMGQAAMESGGEVASTSTPVAKRLKMAEDGNADEDSDDNDANMVEAKMPAGRLKSLPPEDEEEHDIKMSGRASPQMTAEEVAAAKPPPPPPPPPELMTQSFPQRLMEMLDKEVVPDAMWWAEEGRAFAMDLSKFGDVLHRHFQATKYASFTRKLNKWGFRKINNIDPDAPDSVVLYRHELFQKDKPDLLASMSTKRKKKDKSKDKDSKKRKDDSNKSDDEFESEGDLKARDASEDTTDVELQVQAVEDEKQDQPEEEEKAHSMDSPPQRLPHLRPLQESESKSEGTSDFVRQQMQQQLSLASSLATHRITGQHQQQPTMVPERQVAARRRDPSTNQSLLESWFAQESEQQQEQQRLELALLRQQQENLANEMVAQRQLAASTNRLPLHLASSISLEERLAALQDPALQGIHQLTSTAGRTIPPARSHSMNDIPSALTQGGNYNELAARLRLQQAQAQATDMTMSLGLPPQNLSDLRAALEARSQADIASTLQLLASPSSPAQSRLAMRGDTLSGFDLLSPRSGAAATSNAAAGLHSTLHHSRSFPDTTALLQMQLQIEQQAGIRRASTSSAASLSAAGGALAGAAGLGGSAGAASFAGAASLAGAGGAASLAGAARSNQHPTDQQLLEILLERQRLQQQLQEEHQRRQQRR